jgi:hypothetical protein
MIEIKELAAQGDVLFRRIDLLPDNVVERSTRGTIVVAHSETGHHHAIHDAGVRLFEDPDVGATAQFLEIGGDFADVVHHRSHDTHQTLRLPRGVWEVRRQREWAPDGWHSVDD